MASEEPDHPTQAIAPSRDTPEGTDLKQPPSEKHPIQEASSVDSSGRNKSDREVEEAGEVSSQPWHRHRLFKHVRHVVYAVIWLLFTGWWITGLILHRYDLGWLIPFLIYLAITLRMIFFYLPIATLTRPVYWVWNQTASRFVSIIPEKFRVPSAALLTIGVILLGSFVTEESGDNTRANRAVSLFGLVVFLFVLWATSRDRKRINWHTVIVGMLVQFIIALFVLRTKAGYDIFNFISFLARELLHFASEGVDFLLEPGFAAKHSAWFLINVIPAIMFFVSLVQLLYYSGVLQWAVGKFAVFFFWSMRVSGAEAVVAAASPFIGQGESAMLIKPFVPYLTMAEIHQVMCSGFATIAGSVLVAYIGMGINPQALVSSCVMSIPASLAVSKLRWPEEEETLTAGRVVVPEDESERAVNALHAFANGAWMGIKIAGMIGTTLLCIISLVGLVNGLLTWWGHYLNIRDPELNLQLILGYLCYPIAFLLGVSRDGDLLKVGKLLGTKLIMNEFVAYHDLQKGEEYQDLSDRSRLIATYALCGFANIGSIGQQIGVLGQLAPGRSGDVSRVAVSAMLTGAISTFTSAAIAGMLITNEKQYFTEG
ncbi:NupC/NupG family nucleoside CNT transporter [Aspergillus candidus]|uniref:Na+ dependent nucleoside transporter C-terminus-domain-containing protein n=1 Tax=Aspergillus candidus TaxID=41067 RepID=A0A2I2F2F6_ASPCN|nr:Na+ dependent nucleoside transporter C-terminus-domain-containing protein [Aspergillus candidus]PLB34825.1 Na+ dependent nucleoside transporter C-terminus-domain-containing protein [Aspergillus candidus]